MFQSHLVFGPELNAAWHGPAYPHFTLELGSEPWVTRLNALDMGRHQLQFLLTVLWRQSIPRIRMTAEALKSENWRQTVLGRDHSSKQLICLSQRQASGQGRQQAQVFTLAQG